MEQITENVFVETKVRGCNSGFVVTSEGIVLIDTGIDLDFLKSWSGEIAKRGKVRYTLNTEHHMDHFVGNSLFSGDVISHRAARETMMKMNVEFIRKRSEFLYIDPCPIPDGYQLKRPNITFTEQMDLYVGAHTFQLIHIPGHTAGQAAVYIPKEKVVFVGDAVFHQTKTASHDGDIEKWLESLRVLEKLDVRFIIPGHGTSVCDKTYLETQSSILLKRLASDKEIKAGGKILDDAAHLAIDPYYKTKDTGIKVEISLASTSSAMSTSKHG